LIHLKPAGHGDANAITANKDVLWSEVCERAKRETPATGWPPGKSPDDYYLGPSDCDLEPAADVSATFLGKLAAGDPDRQS